MLLDQDHHLHRCDPVKCAAENVNLSLSRSACMAIKLGGIEGGHIWIPAGLMDGQRRRHATASWNSILRMFQGFTSSLARLSFHM